MSSEQVAGPDMPPIRILVVEDDPGLNRVVCQALERRGLEAIEALTGEDAARVIGQGPVDIVLLDYSLPSMTAEDLLEQISQIEPSPAVIAMTGHGSEKVAAEMLRRGVRDYIVKDDLFYTHLMHSVDQAVQDRLRLRDMRRLQNEVAEANTRFRALYEEAPLPYHSLDADGRILQVNTSWLRLLGYERDEVVGRSIADFLVPRFVATFEKMLALARSEPGTSVMDVELVARSGAAVPVRVYCCVLRDESGALVRTHCILQDMTDVRLAEAQAERREQEFARIIETAQEGVWVMDEQMRTTFVNPRMCAILGYSETELLGRRPTDFIRDADLAAHAEEMRRREHGEPGRYVRRFVAADGSIRHLLVSATSITDSDGAFRGSFAMLTDVSEIICKQRALEAAERKTASILRAAPVGIGLVADRVILEVNDAMCTLVGYTRDELVGQSARILYPDDAEFERVGREKYAEMLTKGKGAIETRWRRKDGTVLDIRLSSAFLDAEHPDRGATFTAMDITDLERSRNFLECIINAVADPIFVKDADHRWVLVNEANCKLAGVSRTDMLGGTDHVFFPKEQADAFWADDDEVLRTGRTKTVVEELTDASGNLRTVMTTKALHVGPVGEKYIVGISKDVTELTRTQNDLKRSRARLESLYRLAQTDFDTDKSLMEYALEEVVRLTDSEIGYAHFMGDDEVDLRLFAWSRKALEECIAPVSEKYPLLAAGVWADCARTRRPVIHNDYQNLPERKGYPEGHMHLSRHMSVPVLDEGRVVMIAGVGNKREPYDETDAQDFQLYMTEVWQLLSRRRAEFDLRRSYAEMEERVNVRTQQLQDTVAELDAFSYSVSHDLTSPLRHMDQYCGYLAEDYGDRLDDDGRRYIERIRAGIRKMREMTQALLRLSRASRTPLHRVPVDVSAAALDILDELREAEPDRRVECRVEEGLRAECDEHFLRVVLQNLLGNAWKYTSKRSEGLIEVGEAELDGKRAFFVRDNGAGFDLASAKRLFTAFQRFHDDADFPGIGIGLATVRRVVRRHGGEIWADSAPDKGATFYFTLHE